MLPKPLTGALIVVITVVWVANVVVGYYDPTRGNTAVNAIFTIVIGVLFGGPSLAKARRTAKREKDPADDQDPSDGAT